MNYCMKDSSLINIKILLIIAALCSTVVIKGQDYKNLVSFKTSYTTGFSYKRLLENESALSAHVDFKDSGIALSGFRSFHKLAFPNKSYKFFLHYGYGAHLRYFKKQSTLNLFKPLRPTINYYGNFFGIGIDGLIGLEYRFLKYPFVASCDFNPNLEVGGPRYIKLYASQVFLAIGYTF